MAPSVDVRWKVAWSFGPLCQKDVALHLRPDLGLSLSQQSAGLWHERCHRIRAVLLGIGLERQRAIGHFALCQRVVGRGRARGYIRRRSGVEPTITLPAEIRAGFIVDRVS